MIFISIVVNEVINTKTLWKRRDGLAVVSTHNTQEARQK